MKKSALSEAVRINKAETLELARHIIQKLENDVANEKRCLMMENSPGFSVHTADLLTAVRDLLQIKARLAILEDLGFEEAKAGYAKAFKQKKARAVAKKAVAKKGK